LRLWVVVAVAEGVGGGGRWQWVWAVAVGWVLQWVSVWAVELWKR